MTERVAQRFRGLLVSLGRKLTPEEAKGLALIYLDKESTGQATSGTEVVERILKGLKIQNCKCHLQQLKESLSCIGWSNLVDDVVEHLTQHPSLPEDISEPAASAITVGLQENESNISGFPVGTCAR
jgi:hypothetical protein